MLSLSISPGHWSEKHKALSPKANSQAYITCFGVIWRWSRLLCVACLKVNLAQSVVLSQQGFSLISDRSLIKKVTKMCMQSVHVTLHIG